MAMKAPEAPWPHLVHGDDVRMRDGRGGAGLAQQPDLRAAVRIGSGGDDLEGDEAVEAVLPHEGDHAHAAAAEFGDEFIFVRGSRRRGGG
jgi:hypothetical protein